MESTVKEKFASYPQNARAQLMKIREEIFAVARDEKLGEVEEVLKWDEPSYLVKGGSTLRIDWKAKSPNEIFVYFNCKTSLVETIKEIYGDLFTYQGNRALVLELSKTIPLAELKHCISLTLRYHKIKNLPLLGG